MDYSRQQIVKAASPGRAERVADIAEAALPGPIDAKTVDQFCTTQGVSLSTLMDRLGASP